MLDYYEGLRRVDPVELGGAGGKAGQRANRKTSFAGFYESPTNNVELSATVERTRRISREGANLLRRATTASGLISFVVDELDEEPMPSTIFEEPEMVAFQPEMVRATGPIRTPLGSSILRLYLARLSLARPPKRKRRQKRAAVTGCRDISTMEGDSGAQSGGGTNEMRSLPDNPAIWRKPDENDSSDESITSDSTHCEDLDEVSRRLTAELMHLQHKGTTDQGEIEPSLRQGSFTTIGAPQTAFGSNFDITKVYQGLANAPGSANDVRTPDMDFIEMPQPVVEQRRKNRETNMMAPVSF